MDKLIYVLLDGVGDRPNPKLNYLTPLEAAYTPNLDKLVRKGISGIVHPVGKGISPESDIAVFCMLGYDFSSNYFGRGVVETIGVGMNFKNGDLALRANFATLGDNGIVTDRRAGRNLSQKEAGELSDSINNAKLSHNASFEFVPTIAHRAILNLKIENKKLSAEISNTDPAYDRIGGIGVAKETNEKLYLQKSRPLKDIEGARLAADLVNEFTEKVISILKTHKVNTIREKNGMKPANILLLRDAGDTLPNITKIPDRFRVKFASILDMPVEKGVSKITGMRDYKAGNISDYHAKAKKTTELLQTHDGVYIHIKGPDEPGHDGDAERKTKIVEQIDSDFFSTLIQEVDLEHTIFLISADHSTPCTIKGHSADPVPVLISGHKVEPDNVCRFTEKEAAKGGLGVMLGKNVLPKALSFR
jgi:2,3-bisphosphoglycerate-independent phosphoglycerate mutase|tara:strand:- start:1600 stop:2853 length:1254 start_codon:yes stop_codon:yes gene_type:complete